MKKYFEVEKDGKTYWGFADYSLVGKYSELDYFNGTGWQETTVSLDGFTITDACDEFGTPIEIEGKNFDFLKDEIWEATHEDAENEF